MASRRALPGGPPPQTADPSIGFRAGGKDDQLPGRAMIAERPDANADGESARGVEGDHAPPGVVVTAVREYLPQAVVSLRSRKADAERRTAEAKEQLEAAIAASRERQREVPLERAAAEAAAERRQAKKARATAEHRAMLEADSNWWESQDTEALQRMAEEVIAADDPPDLADRAKQHPVVLRSRIIERFGPNSKAEAAA